MANKQRGYIEIELDKTRRLRYTLNSLAEIEEKLGVPVQKLAEAEMGMKAVRVFLWAGLIHEDAELTEREVGEMVDFDNFQYVQEKIAEAFQNAVAKN